MNCPKCGKPINKNNFNRCSRFPICDYIQPYESHGDTRMLSYIMFDFETTGVGKDDTIIEIGAIKVIENKIVDKFSMLVNPGTNSYGKQIYITKRIENITGITNAMLIGQKNEEQAVKEFLDFVGDITLALGQNIISFDFRFLKKACKRYGYQFPFTHVIDTLVIARDRLQLKKKEYVSSCSQEALAAFYGFSYNAHRALDDVEALYRIYNHLLDTAHAEKIDIYPEKINEAAKSLK